MCEDEDRPVLNCTMYAKPSASAIVLIRLFVSEEAETKSLENDFSKNKLWYNDRTHTRTDRRNPRVKLNKTL